MKQLLNANKQLLSAISELLVCGLILLGLIYGVKCFVRWEFISWTWSEFRSSWVKATILFWALDNFVSPTIRKLSS